jgi:hypothetical protein
MVPRRVFTAGFAAACTAMLTACGTIIYPDRVNQTNRKNLDPAVIILDGIGLFFFLIPGLVAFAVDFATGAIYLPEDQETKERTIFDDLGSNARAEKRLQQQDIELIVGRHVGQTIDLGTPGVRVMRIEALDQFWLAHAKCSQNTLLS